jgi:plastocyanin
VGLRLLPGAAALLAMGLGSWFPESVAQQRASVRGRVELPPGPAVVARRPAPGALGARPAIDVTDRRRAVVYFESAPKGAFEDRQPGRATLDQRNERFVPHVLAVTVGTVVDFPNSDEVYHNVFSLSKAKRFDLGRYATGRSKAVRFDRPGIVRVFCDIHSHMNAFVLVFSHRFFDVTDEEGRYRIDGVPPGRYQLLAWLEGTVRDSRQVTIAPDSRSVEVDFTLR